MLEFFLWVIFIYFVLRLFVRYALPFILRRALRKFERKVSSFGSPAARETREEGSVRIDHIPPTTAPERRADDNIEYTDFEEIKE